MGFLKHLLFWPVTGPAYLARFSLEKVQGVVHEELTDDGRVKAALLELQLQLELGEVDEEEYVREEDRLMAELRDIRRWREELGMGTRGGVVRLPGEAPPSTEAEQPPRDTSIPRGATLEVSVDWDEAPGDGGVDR